MKLVYSGCFTALVLLSGCAIPPTAQNAQEFRQVVQKGSYGSLYETYDVDNDYSKVASTLMAKSNECLNKTITQQECFKPGSCVTRGYTLIPHFTKKANGAELVVQYKPSHVNAKDVYLGGPPPEGGAYIAVADAAPIANGKTKVTMYGAKVSLFAHIPKAVKHWTNGTNLGCPDFSSDL